MFYFEALPTSDLPHSQYGALSRYRKMDQSKPRTQIDPGPLKPNAGKIETTYFNSKKQRYKTQHAVSFMADGFRQNPIEKY